jgi:hypothetical protein
MRLRTIAIAVSAAGLLALLVCAPTFAAAADESDIEQMVQNAKTPADHEAIAKFYDQEAADARKKAAEHRKMGDGYKHVAPFGMKGQHSGYDMPKHCANLVRSYDAAAKDSEAMAAAHRKMAQAAR